MKKSHRRAHGFIWLLLAPVLVLVLYFADQTRLAPIPAEDNILSPSAAGKLP